MEEWIDEWMIMNEWKGLMDGLMNERIDEWDGWMDEWMVKWKNESIDE